MANFTDFFTGSNIAVWEEAIGAVFANIEDQRQAALAAIYLSTAALSELNDHYAVLTGGKPDPSWQLEVFREHLQETIQAFLMLSSTRSGVQQVVAATTMIPPTVKSISLLRRWLLGFQYLPNRFFTRLDGFVTAEVDDPYTITEDNNTLIVSVNGDVSYTITLPTGEAITAQEVVDAINAVIVGAQAVIFGHRFRIEATTRDTTGSVRVLPLSTADTLFGLDNFTHPNAPVSVTDITLAGVLPFGWRLVAPEGSVSNPTSLDDAMFAVGGITIKGDEDSPFVGLGSNKFIDNGGFEQGFLDWDQSLGPDFFISTSKVHSGTRALGINTRSGANDNILQTALKNYPLGTTLHVDGFHQAHTVGPVYASPSTPPSKFRWLSSEAVFGYADGQNSQAPLAVNEQLPTMKLNDTSVNFIAAGVKVGMAVHVESGGNLFTGVIMGIGTHDLLIDGWRQGPSGDPTTAYISNGGFTANVSYNVKAMSDPTKDFISLGVQTGVSFDLQDKLRVDESINEFGVTVSQRQVVRDIQGITTDSVSAHDALVVLSWGGSPIPPHNAEYFVYIRPKDGASYNVFNSLGAVVTSSQAVADVSAQFKYEFLYYDINANLIGHDDTGFILPTPSTSYTTFLLEKVPPVGTRKVQLAIHVLPDPAGGGALATIDDITWKTVEEFHPEFHVASDGRMQKVVFKSEATFASGQITYTAIPQDGDTVTVDTVTFEFDLGAHASGVLTYTTQPADTDLFQIGSTIFEFDNDCVVSPGHVQVFIGSTADDTFQNLASAVSSLVGGLVTVVQDKVANTITFTARPFGPSGNNIFFIKGGGVTAFTLNPNGGFLTGGDNSAVSPGNQPIPIGGLDDTFQRLTSAITADVPTVTATIDTTKKIVTVTAVTEGTSGNTIAFSDFAPDAAYSLVPANGFLNGGTAQNAAGSLTYTGQPSDGDVVVIGQTEYEFDSNDSGICPGAVPIFINPSGVGFTYSGLVNSVNAHGEAVATLDVIRNFIGVTATTPGTAGNSTPFRKDSSVLVINPTQGDTSPQTATATAGTARAYAAALVTYETGATPPTITANANSATLSTVQTVNLPITTDIVPGEKIIVCVSTTNASGFTAIVTDSAGAIYDSDAGVFVGGRTVFVYSHTTGTGLKVANADSITVDAGVGQTFTGISVSIISATLTCRRDTTTLNDNASATSLSVGPSPVLHVSGELILGAFAVMGPNSDIFTTGPGYTLINRSGTGAGANQNTINPVYRIASSSHLDGAINAGLSGLSGDLATCSQVAAYLNARLSGIVAFCEVVSGLFPNGRIGIRTTYSGVNACLVVGHGSANKILGFVDDTGECNDFETRRSAWEVAIGNSGIVQMITKAEPPASKFFGTEWHLRFWAKAFHPSGIAVSSLTPSGVIGYASFKFDSGDLQTGTPVQITETPTVVEIIDVDPGKRFSEALCQITFSGCTSGIRVVASEPYFINEQGKSLHLSDNTIPRNKQREYKLQRLNVANPDSFTDIETGLIGLSTDVNQEPLILVPGEVTDLKNKNLFPKSETVLRTGAGSHGTIGYSDTTNPADGDSVQIGDDVYEFDNNFTLNDLNAIQVIIGLTPDATFQNFVDQINSNSQSVSASLDTVLNTVTITALTPGSLGDETVFAGSSAVLTFTPTLGHLIGGIESVTFQRDTDYTMFYATGQIARATNSTISDPSPADLAIDYSFYPGGIDRSDSYPSNIKPVGIKVEPDFTQGFFYYGRDNDFRNISGINLNFQPVTRVPSRFSFLKPVVRGKYAQVVTFSGVGFSAPLDFNAVTDQDALLLKNGAAIPQSGTGWTFLNDKTATIAASEFDATAVYEIEYMVKFQYTSAPITIPDAGSTYVFLPYSYKMRNAEESMVDVAKVLILDENRDATLSLPAVQDQSLSTITRTLAGEVTTLNDDQWQYLDDKTVEIFVSAFDDAASYTLTYKSSKITYTTPVTENWEVATSPDGIVFTAFAPINPGDTFASDAFAMFRVTVFGDFDVDDYRLRSIAGILDSSDLSGCGFGIEPFGKLPFGGCGEETETEPTNFPQSIGGTISMFGSLTTSITTALPNWLVPGRWYINFQHWNTIGTSYAANTVNAVPYFVGGKAHWTGLALSGTGLNGTGNIAIAVYECDSNGVPNNMVYSTGIIACPSSNPYITTGLDITTTTDFIAVAFWSSATKTMDHSTPGSNYAFMGDDNPVDGNNVTHFSQSTASGPQNPGSWTEVSATTTSPHQSWILFDDYLE